MALSKLNTAASADAGVAITIRHPSTNKPVGIKIVVFGSDSRIFRATIRRRQDRDLERSRLNRNKPVVRSPEEVESDSLDLLVACTKEWFTVDENDKPIRQEIELDENEWVACTPEQVRRVYSDIGFTWIRDQVDEGIGDRGNFLEK